MMHFVLSVRKKITEINNEEHYHFIFLISFIHIEHDSLTLFTRNNSLVTSSKCSIQLNQTKHQQETFKYYTQKTFT